MRTSSKEMRQNPQFSRRAAQSPAITRSARGSLQTLIPKSPPVKTPRGVIHMVRQLKALITKDTPNSEQPGEWMDTFGMIAEGLW